MQRRPRIWLMVLLWCVPAGLWAQDQVKTNAGSSERATGVVVAKPVRKPDQVITNDSIGLLAVRRAARVVPPAEAAEAATMDDGATGDAAATRARDIASLQKQIQEKQKRIVLLMKLFVEDEREFLKNSGAVEANRAAQERRRYEQDELRWETAELAKAQTRLEELKSGNRK